MDDVKSAGEAAVKAVKEAAEATVASVGEKLGAGSAPLPLPNDRTQLMALHREARRRRDAAPLMSTERGDAVRELERIEVHVARIERAMDPPLV